METYDCVVVGAGCYGLAAAKQYRFTHPDHSIRVFASEDTIGGTWAEERLYPNLKSNNLLGTLEYPDFPMDPERFAVEQGCHVSGSAIHAYLKAYAVEFGLSDFIHLRTKVTVAEHLGGQNSPQGGWILTVIDLEKQEAAGSKVHARRLIVASGLTSVPRIPQLPGEEHFGGRIFHTKFFAQNVDTLKTARSVTILGGSKSAWDAAYSYATAGVQVNWVIRCMLQTLKGLRVMKR
ncbi:putative flavin-containing monooxygenase 1 [Escovopsis weberi]|uniref:Putative flavin-containing monooxygenase 1 n=1 Tax=Escovopsis weberi TaxID=150374 RepID=A0A0M9VW52_ESCWE|nr:putative flavin-containing monooxygenase 1 [Escovopsis weberi]